MMQSLLSFLHRSLASIIVLAIYMGVIFLLTEKDNSFMKKEKIGPILTGWRVFWARYFKSKIRFILTLAIAFILNAWQVIVAAAITTAITLLIETTLKIGRKVENKKLIVGIPMTIISVIVPIIILFSTIE